jgi:hypothetical protein
MHGLIQSGLIYTVVSTVTGMGNMLFNGVLQHRLANGEGQYGDANSALNGFVPLLGVLPTIALFAVTHYIAHFKGSGDEARLQGLMAGCRKFLLSLTIAGSIIALIVIKPLSSLFHYSQTMVLVMLACVFLTLWSSMISAFCQGLSWFKRLALIGFLAMVFKVIFGWLVTLRWPSSETAVLAGTVSLLAYLLVFIWRRELLISAKPVSPWNREFVHYLIISTACVLGNYFFLRGDLLVAQSFFGDGAKDAYNRAETLATALPITAAPLLTVLFTSRSSTRSGNIVFEQFKLLGLYIFALLFGAVALVVLRRLLIQIMAGHSIPMAEGMIGHLALAMLFVGLLQAIAFWALSSRWHKISLLYGGLGLLYWVTLFSLGKTPEKLLTVMPVATGVAFVLMLVVWITCMRRHHPVHGKTVTAE